MEDVHDSIFGTHMRWDCPWRPGKDESSDYTSPKDLLWKPAIEPYLMFSSLCSEILICHQKSIIFWVKYGEIWWNMVKYGEIWWNMVKSPVSSCFDVFNLHFPQLFTIFHHFLPFLSTMFHHFSRWNRHVQQNFHGSRLVASWGQVFVTFDGDMTHQWIEITSWLNIMK